MRQIKFRAWNRFTKSMFDADLLRNDELRDLESDEYRIYMQYTGLKDRNKKEIFEGDIICWEQAKGDHIQEIKWDYADLHAMKMGTEDFKNIKVIGNIYENPKLLKQ